MKNNPIDELRNMKVPVSEQEWESIVHDKQYVKKFGRKPGLSAKGRAALFAGAAAVLLTIPVLFSILSHKTTDTAQDKRPEVQTVAPQPETVNELSRTVSPVTTTATTSPKSEVTPKALPSASSTVSNSAVHEQSTLVAVTEARIPSNNPAAQKANPAVSTSTPPPAKSIAATPKTMPAEPVSAKHESHKSISDNPHIVIAEENQPAVEKSQDETIADADEFFIPSAFTPNGDGLNDLFMVKANFTPRTFEMNIFNRKGELLFHSQDMDMGWDGQLHGQTLPSGVYVCIIKYTDEQGISHKTQGQVLILP